MQQVMDEILELGEVGVSKACQKMICQFITTSMRFEEGCRVLLKTAEHDGTLRTNDFSSHVVTIEALRVGLNIAYCTFLEPQVH